MIDIAIEADRDRAVYRADIKPARTAVNAHQRRSGRRKPSERGHNLERALRFPRQLDEPSLVDARNDAGAR